MTAGYDGSGAEDRRGAVPPDDARGAPAPRPPLPQPSPPSASTYPPPASGAYPPPASGAYPPPASGPYPPPAPPAYQAAEAGHGAGGSGQRPAPPTGTTWSPPPQANPWGAPAPAEYGGWGQGVVPPAGGPATGGAPAASHPPPSGPAVPFPGPPGAWPGTPPVPASTAPGRGGSRRLAVLLLAVLVLVTGVQAYQIHRLTDRLDDTDRRLDTAQADTGARLDGLEAQAKALDEQVSGAFDPEAIATAVLPSVFRVRAGRFTGSAFAVGKPATQGGTNLFTNFHVVEAVWDSGGRKVFLERTDQRFPATIVKVDKVNDIAHLRTSSKFTGLVAAPAAVKSGQQIVVVGAPLGLEDSVTTGVVSAFRKAEGGDPPAIQFDAPINPGNSGGPVINGSKQVVGIATAKARNAEGIGLAVPIKTACDGFKIC
ncbi:trypsin-like peptidase domain-containing protein [Micromonospora sp. NPDC126480]|uniref:S1C family serine protease n=1 Tax=Micromonospora sp. NPDC126480 TaxID=3155312 RepID=UPI00331E70CA